MPPDKIEEGRATLRAFGVCVICTSESRLAFTTHTLKDDGQSQSLMITSWVGAVKIVKTLAHGRPNVDLVSKRKLWSMVVLPPAQIDGYLRVILATDTISSPIAIFMDDHGASAITYVVYLSILI